MYLSLRNVSESFVDRIKKQPGSSHFIEVLIVLLTYYKCSILEKFCSDYKNKSLLRFLLRKLAVDESYSEMSNQTFLCHYEKSIGEILKMLVYKSHVSEWIFAVPLLHLVTKQCEPYARLKGIDWNHDTKG